MEILIVGLILYFVLEYNKKLSTNKFINDNKQYFNFLKEDNYEFLLKAKYGDKVDPEKAFMKRIRNALLVILLLIFIFLSKYL